MPLSLVALIELTMEESDLTKIPFSLIYSAIKIARSSYWSRPIAWNIMLSAFSVAHVPSASFTLLRHTGAVSRFNLQHARAATPSFHVAIWCPLAEIYFENRSRSDRHGQHPTSLPCEDNASVQFAQVSRYISPARVQRSALSILVSFLYSRSNDGHKVQCYLGQSYCAQRLREKTDPSLPVQASTGEWIVPTIRGMVIIRVSPM